MGLLDSIKSKVKKEERDAAPSETLKPAVQGNHLPAPAGMAELEPPGMPELEQPQVPQTAPPGMPELSQPPQVTQEQYPQYQQAPVQAPITQSPEIQGMKSQLEIINSKLDTLKVQIENLIQTLTVINAKLR